MVGSKINLEFVYSNKELGCIFRSKERATALSQTTPKVTRKFKMAMLQLSGLRITCDLCYSSLLPFSQEEST